MHKWHNLFPYNPPDKHTYPLLGARSFHNSMVHSKPLDIHAGIPLHTRRHWPLDANVWKNRTSDPDSRFHFGQYNLVRIRKFLWRNLFHPTLIDIDTHPIHLWFHDHYKRPQGHFGYLTNDFPRR